jgi:hypothetical protein
MAAANAANVAVTVVAPVTAIYRDAGRISRWTNSERAIDAADDAADNTADQTADRPRSLRADIRAVRHAVRDALCLRCQWKRQ